MFQTKGVQKIKAHI